MRTTIRLDDHLLREIKRLAHATGRTVTAVIEEALRERLARPRAESKYASASLPTYKGDGLLPGVDLDKNARLLERMGRK